MYWQYLSLFAVIKNVKYLVKESNLLKLLCTLAYLYNDSTQESEVAGWGGGVVHHHEFEVNLRKSF